MNEQAPITVVYHSADFDGIFSREIAKKFLPKDTVFIGWNHGDKPLDIPAEGMIYVIDLPVDSVFSDQKPVLAVDNGELCFLEANPPLKRIPLSRLIWIDHHASAIASHPDEIWGYRIDGVAACRLAWQWFSGARSALAGLSAFKERKVREPYAVTLAGEYDIWDHERSNFDDEAFQFGLHASKLEDVDWSLMLNSGAYEGWQSSEYVDNQIAVGRTIKAFLEKQDAERVASIGFIVEIEGLKFLALNSPFKGSQQFRSKDKPETGHDALLKFNWTGEVWDCSMYHAEHRKDIDLSVIAKKFGGGGHKGACGFRVNTLPFLS